MDPLIIDFKELGSLTLRLEDGLPRMEIQAAHLGEKNKHTSTTVVLSKKSTEQVAIWLAAVLEIMEAENNG